MTLTFAKPQYLALLLIVPYVILFSIRTGTRKKNQRRKFSSDIVSAHMFIEIHPLTRAAKWLLACLVFAALSFALAQPHYNERIERVKLRNVDVIFLLDVSRSMSATDVPPASTRLQLAKRKVSSLKDLIISDRIGLVVFSNRAYTLCPLTIDKNAFDFFLDDVDTDMISSGGTNISAAITKAVDSFHYQTQTEKIIVLISDGEEPEIEGDPIAAAGKAAEKGIGVFVLGIDSEEGSHINEIDADTGTRAFSVPDMSKLRSIAEEGDGLFTEWSNSDSDVRKLADTIASAVEPSIFEVQTRSRNIEFSMITIMPYQVLVFLAIVMLCMETFIKN
jgi:Ca-activated chloride channel family protein